jgi:hypothetical protein
MKKHPLWVLQPGGLTNPGEHRTEHSPLQRRARVAVRHYKACICTRQRGLPDHIANANPCFSQ